MGAAGGFRRHRGQYPAAGCHPAARFWRPRQPQSLPDAGALCRLRQTCHTVRRDTPRTDIQRPAAMVCGGGRVQSSVAGTPRRHPFSRANTQQPPTHLPEHDEGLFPVSLPFRGQSPAEPRVPPTASSRTSDGVGCIFGGFGCLVALPGLSCCFRSCSTWNCVRCARVVVVLGHIFSIS